MRRPWASLLVLTALLAAGPVNAEEPDSIEVGFTWRSEDQHPYEAQSVLEHPLQRFWRKCSLDCEAPVQAVFDFAEADGPPVPCKIPFRGYLKVFDEQGRIIRQLVFDKVGTVTTTAGEDTCLLHTKSIFPLLRATGVFANPIDRYGPKRKEWDPAPPRPRR
jgi:hypothetical protein